MEKKWPVIYKNSDQDNPITLFKWIDVSPNIFEPLFIYEAYKSELMYGIDSTNDKIFVLLIHHAPWGNGNGYTRTKFSSLKEAKRFACKLVPFVFPEVLHGSLTKSKHFENEDN